MESKACTKCLVIKPLSEFSKRTDRKNKIKSECKDCFKKRGKEYRKKFANLLDEHYLKDKLIRHGFTAEQITPELIAMKREQLEIMRMAKQLKQAANKSP